MVRVLPGPAGAIQSSNNTSNLISGNKNYDSDVLLLQTIKQYFNTKQFKSACQSFNVNTNCLSILDTHSNDDISPDSIITNELINSFISVFGSSVELVHKNNTDLKVPHILVVISKIVQISDTSIVLTLIDPSSPLLGIQGYMSGDVACMHSGIRECGSCLVLHNVSIFVCKQTAIKHLNICQRNVVAVFSSK